MNFMKFCEKRTEAYRDAFSWYLFYTLNLDYELDRPASEWRRLAKQFKSHKDTK